jgi:predicted ArsR family transcriptional regulator
MSSSLEAERSEDDLGFARIAKRLGEPRRELLQSFLETDMSVVNTAELRETTSVARGSVIHHLERLAKWGLVEEQAEREYHGRGGRDARTWRLTDRGHEFCDQHVDTPVSAFVSPEDVAALDQRISAIEDDIDVMGQLIVEVAIDTGTMDEEKGEKLLNQRGWK